MASSITSPSHINILDLPVNDNRIYLSMQTCQSSDFRKENYCSTAVGLNLYLTFWSYEINALDFWLQVNFNYAHDFTPVRNTRGLKIIYIVQMAASLRLKW